MPQISKVLLFDVTPEKFLDACSPEELMEVELLLGLTHYQEKINNQKRLDK